MVKNWNNCRNDCKFTIIRQNLIFDNIQKFDRSQIQIVNFKFSHICKF